ncbi:hypothetical protein SRIMM317S_05832 [Streptomyces rimosus subsp. rimosus]
MRVRGRAGGFRGAGARGVIQGLQTFPRYLAGITLRFAIAKARWRARRTRSGRCLLLMTGRCRTARPTWVSPDTSKEPGRDG